MNDIVERLREVQGDNEDAREAAAAIVRLRAALHDIGIGGNGDRNWTLEEVRAVAWDALATLAGKNTA